MRKDRINGEHDDAHAEAEIAAVDIDGEFQKEGQPQPSCAIEGEVALELALQPGAKGEGQGCEQEQPGNRLLERGLPRPDEDQRTDEAARCRQDQPQHQVLAHRVDFVAINITAHHIGRQDRHKIGGICLNLAHARRYKQGKGHEPRPAGHDINNAGQNPTCE